MLVKPVDAKPNFVECLFSIFLKVTIANFSWIVSKEPLPSGYPALSSSKFQQVTKIA